jgi:ABC-type spermidine/putrescine transport system permease subunit II
MTVQGGSGSVSAGGLGMALAGLVGGGIAGVVLGGAIGNEIALAFVCAFVGTILALIVAHYVLDRNAGASLPQGVVVWNVIVATVIGGLAGHELSVDLRTPPGSSLIGGLSGLLAAILIASFAMTMFALLNRLRTPKI